MTNHPDRKNEDVQLKWKKVDTKKATSVIGSVEYTCYPEDCLLNVLDSEVTEGNRCLLEIYTVQEGMSDHNPIILQESEDEDEGNQQGLYQKDIGQ